MTEHEYNNGRIESTEEGGAERPTPSSYAPRYTHSPTSLNVGDRVYDREQLPTRQKEIPGETPAIGVVVDCPFKTITEAEVSDTGESVADANPTYSTDDAVVGVVWGEELDAAAAYWRELDPLWLHWSIHEDVGSFADLTVYQFPRSRLVSLKTVAAMIHEETATGATEEGESNRRDAESEWSQ